MEFEFNISKLKNRNSKNLSWSLKSSANGISKNNNLKQERLRVF